mmetsp:Transcript_32991/g.74665  ORF Transcript_32991/g.74665 Transcript_32991/m.74665 type:complete len:418 (+) Transcript_32991:178-1431(+)
MQLSLKLLGRRVPFEYRRPTMASSVAMYVLILALTMHRVRQLDCFTPRPTNKLAVNYKHSALFGKGDGKKRRKKKSSAPNSSPEEAAQPAPLRVSSDSNVSVKRQIKWARMNKEYFKSQTSFRQNNVKKKTAYRKRLDDEEQQQVIEDKRKRARDVDWDVVLSHGNGTATPLMLVDGYNVVYQWPRLKKQMLKGHIERARDMLIRDLEDLHGIKGWRIECVFDGFGRSTVGPLGESPASGKVSLLEREFNRQDTGRGVRIVYSGVGASADSYIEKRCLDAKAVTQGKLSVSKGSLIVASNDAMIRTVAVGSGALCMSSERLVDELKAVKKATAYRVEAAMAIANGGFVRPEALRQKQSTNLPAMKMQGARGSVGFAEVNGRQVMNTYRGGQFVIEDKRKKKKEKNCPNPFAENDDGS